MGCDIHAYIDYDNGEDQAPRNLCRIKIARDYWLFGVLAGVRLDPGVIPGEKQLFAPRGLPEKLSWEVEDENSLYVVADKEDEDVHEGCCERSNAEKWTKSGWSTWLNEDHTRITHPDWHTHSYLYVDELEKVQEQYARIPGYPKHKMIKAEESIPEGYKVDHDYNDQKFCVEINPGPQGPHQELAAAISAMKSLNGDNPKRSRFIFWFDN